MSDADRQKWDARFAAKPLEASPPAPAFLDSLMLQLLPGRVLDLASGDGACALQLARRRLEVTALDISAVALARLQAFAAAEHLPIDCCELDLDDEPGRVEFAASQPGFDNLLICHFKPAQDLWPWLATLLRPGGRLALTTFNLRQHQQRGFPERFCLAPGELQSVCPALKLLDYQSLEHQSQLQGEADEAVYRDSYLFERLV